MLSLAKAHKDYYLEKVGEISPREDYYPKGGAATGRWHGGGAAEMGLDGVVSAGGLVRLFDGQHPVTEEQLGHRLRRDGVAAVAFDVLCGQVVAAVVGVRRRRDAQACC